MNKKKTIEEKTKMKKINETKVSSQDTKKGKTKEQDKKVKQKDSEIEELQKQLQETKDKYLRLSAEFDNYRKRTLKEKIELMKSAGEDVLINILPVMDDFERAMESTDKTKEIKAVKDGIKLIYNKFKEFLKLKGIKEIETKNKEFNTDIHEAITKFPVKDKKMKGKIVDVVEKGYYLNDKVIRFSKVVVGE
ncbi:MAG: nucleotide exchange factor GrpE [Bacteroidales bacterium]|nr:nucleotide exchange factor GrpE [Bacteroidales bacterium]